MTEFYIGLMSGTSLDGIDAALVAFDDQQVRLIEFLYTPYPSELKQRIQQLSQANQTIALLDYGQLDSELGELFAAAVLQLIRQTNMPPSAIKAIGSHGQTVYHAPDAPYGFSLQIGDPNRIAQRTGITTISDFRRRDIAVGGQGAPLVPAFHQAVFARSGEICVVLNIGGIANITILDGERINGFDTGPGNTLMDFWCLKHQGKHYDANGEWAATGHVNQTLVQHLLADTYFQLPAPKSTGKEYFSPSWLTDKLTRFADLRPEDVQASLCQLTAKSIADAISTSTTDCQQILVCGGGAHNGLLMKMLAAELSVGVRLTDERGIAADHVEAIAFAWLARQTLNGLSGNLCAVTGAKQPVILGGIYLGR